MATPTDSQHDLESYVSQVAGEVHRQVVEKLIPWTRGDDAERKTLLHAALQELKDTGKVSPGEFESLRELTEDIGAGDAVKDDVLRKVNALREPQPDSQTPLYATLLSIAADSVDHSSAVPIAAADLAGGIFGGVVFGPLGALGGGVGLSVFVAS